MIAKLQLAMSGGGKQDASACKELGPGIRLMRGHCLHSSGLGPPASGLSAP